MPDIFFCLFYFLLFSVFILRSKFFSEGGFSNIYFLGAFYLKLLLGIGLWYIYTHIYKNRITSDIFKYYDDGKMIFATLHTSVKDYFTLLTGIGASNNHYQTVYHTMNSWDNGYDSNLYNNSHFIIRLNAFFMLFSQGHYGVHVIFMCFIALAGLTYIFKAFYPFLADKRKMLFAAVFLFPSVVLWSSGILKEGLVWLGLGLTIYYFFQLINTALPRKYLIAYCLSLISGFILLYEVKAYVLLCLLPGLIAQFLIKKTRFFGRHPVVCYILVLVLYIQPAFFPEIFSHHNNPLHMLSAKQTDFNRISKGGVYLENIKDSNDYAFISVKDTVNIIPLNAWSDSLLHKGIQYIAGKPFWYSEFKSNRKALYMLQKGTPFSQIRIRNKDTIHTIASDSTTYWVYNYIETANSRITIDPIKPNVISLIAHVPAALNVSILLPYPWQIHSAMQAIYCSENIFVLLVFFIALFFIKRPIPHIDLALFCLIYSVMMLILIGLVTPILGGIERYKSVVIPFMFILLLLITKKPTADSKDER
jgi:hypothetical protein